ncbi:MAG TPA: carboxypeptidase-like regulatory domain-containing protein [Gammaproteobacteria bacterium]|nr:carboxypeptidase-like regulatory domain-containing protein [Gammaproteobacteria bacterium]
MPISILGGRGVARVAALGVALTCFAASAAPPELPEGYISGVVTSSRGPEAGVWVIAETTETRTPMIKIVVTGDDGRYVLPQLPTATYYVWVRGYGLVDSPKVKGRPGDTALNLTATLAATPAEAAKVYPGNYWLSLLQPPPKSAFPGTGEKGNGIPPAMESQAHWIYNIKSGCNFCHELGTQITRTLGHMDHLGFKTPEEAWVYRTQLGVRGSSMAGTMAQWGTQAGAKVMADWTTRIANGEVPPQPERPAGIERNVVVTLWDWGNAQSFMHDEISTDKNDPTVNAYGKVYAASSGHGRLTVLDPVANDTYEIVIPTREDPRKVSTRFPPPAMPSNFWGMEHVWGKENPADPHNPMMDRKGRVWSTSKIRENEPDWCKEGSSNKFAKYYPLTFSNRQASVYDPGTGKFELIDTCFATHHLQFDNDADQTLYFNELLGPILGWVNTREYDRTHDEQATQGWCPQIVDSNGDGKITKPWNKAGGPIDPKLDTEVRYNLYSIIPSPVDNSVWGASEDFPGYIVRIDRGNNPPETCVTEVYKVPAPGIDPRGIDIDSNGIVWTALAASSHLASFDRSKCKVLNGPRALAGTHCDAGWTLHVTDGPRFKGTDIPSDFHYFNWVDQHNASGLGLNTPFATGSNSEAILALDPKTGKWLKFRVPYPLGFYHRGMDGRIDDPAAGWKGRGLWANYGTHLIWHTEGGKGAVGKAVHFQIRPDTLAH